MKRNDLKALVEDAFDYNAFLNALYEAISDLIDYDAIADMVVEMKKDQIEKIVVQAALDYLDLPEPELPF